MRFIPGTRVAASALIIALAVTFCANCVPVAAATPAPHVWGAAMDPDCPMAGEHGCCVGETEKVQQGFAAKPFVLSAPSLLVPAIPFDDAGLQLNSALTPAGITAVPKRPGVPTYVLVSSFRI